MIPASNATLTKIAAVGTSDDYDHAATAGATRWESTIGVYVAERLIENIAASKIDELVETRMEIPYTVGKNVVRGDTLTYLKDGISLQRKAGTVWHNQLVGRVRVILETA